MKRGVGIALNAYSLVDLKRKIEKIMQTKSEIEWFKLIASAETTVKYHGLIREWFDPLTAITRFDIAYRVSE